MKFYQIKGSRAAEDVYGWSQWIMQLVACKECSSFLQQGYSYPAADLSSIAAQLPRDAKRLTLESIRELQEKVRGHLPYDVPIGPRSGFGPYTISFVESRLEDFIAKGGLMVTAEVLKAIRKGGLQLGPTVPVSIDPKVKATTCYFQIQVDEFANVQADDPRVGACCPGCGFMLPVSPKKIVLRVDTIPRNTDLFRLAEFPFVVVASERFRDFVIGGGYKGLVFQPVGTDIKKPTSEMFREPRNAKPDVWPLHREPSGDTRASSNATPEKTVKRIDFATALRRRLPKQAAGLLKLSKPAIAFVATPLERVEAAIGNSKTGGLPDLPGTLKWPKRGRKSLAFLAQFNLEELSAHDLTKTFPKSGYLWFFYDLEEQPWGFDPDDSDGWSVIYADVTAANLKRTKLPKGLDEEWLLPESKLNFGTASTLPAAASDSVQALKLSAKDAKAYQDCLKQPAATEDEESPQHQLLGWPAPLQSANMEGECQLAANGINCGEEVEEENPKVKALRAGAKNWRLLLQLDSDNDAGLSWGDGGRLYFWIRQQDLAAQRFDRCWAILRCH